MTMSGDIETKIIDGVVIQQNGIIRNSNQDLIGRLVENISFESSHLTGPPTRHYPAGGDTAITDVELTAFLEKVAKLDTWSNGDTQWDVDWAYDPSVRQDRLEFSRPLPDSKHYDLDRVTVTAEQVQQLVAEVLRLRKAAGCL